jgi:hypothetical protein
MKSSSNQIREYVGSDDKLSILKLYRTNNISDIIKNSSRKRIKTLCKGLEEYYQNTTNEKLVAYTTMLVVNQIFDNAREIELAGVFSTIINPAYFCDIIDDNSLEIGQFFIRHSYLMKNQIDARYYLIKFTIEEGSCYTLTKCPYRNKLKDLINLVCKENSYKTEEINYIEECYDVWTMNIEQFKNYCLEAKNNLHNIDHKLNIICKLFSECYVKEYKYDIGIKIKIFIDTLYDVINDNLELELSIFPNNDNPCDDPLAFIEIINSENAENVENVENVVALLFRIAELSNNDMLAKLNLINYLINNNATQLLYPVIQLLSDIATHKKYSDQANYTLARHHELNDDLDKARICYNKCDDYKYSILKAEIIKNDNQSCLDELNKLYNIELLFKAEGSLKNRVDNITNNIIMIEEWFDFLGESRAQSKIKDRIPNLNHTINSLKYDIQTAINKLHTFDNFCIKYGINNTGLQFKLFMWLEDLSDSYKYLNKKFQKN